MYQEITRGIRVSVNPTYLEGQSDPSQGHYVWAYQVTIANEGPETVQLLTRHWKITDGRGQLHEVQGPGVVGDDLQETAFVVPGLLEHIEADGTTACVERAKEDRGREILGAGDGPVGAPSI